MEAGHRYTGTEICDVSWCTRYRRGVCRHTVFVSKKKRQAADGQHTRNFDLLQGAQALGRRERFLLLRTRAEVCSGFSIWALNTDHSHALETVSSINLNSVTIICRLGPQSYGAHIERLFRL
jgi:hypothetical protein